MRARNIKPGFFQNEALAELPPETRLLFIGLWCVADREGRLEYRPKKIKMQVFPADSFEVIPMLGQLCDAGLIRRYEVGGVEYLEIPNFARHQRPHKNEQVSVIPPPLATKVASASGQGSKHFGLNEERGMRNPDCLNEESSTARSAPFDFDELKLAYPKRAGDQGWPKALRACNARIREGEDWHTIIAGADRYRAYCDATGATGTAFVKQAATFCGPDKHYLEAWKPPPNKGELLVGKNVDEALAWLEAGNGN